MKYSVVFIAAARPNFMKIAPIIRHIQVAAPEIRPILVHTGQHYDPNMSQTFFVQLGIPAPDVNLEIGGGTHSEQAGLTMIAFEKYLEKNRPDMVIVVGDVNATMACAIVAKKLNILVAHIESGLRSFDRTMPEEINRLLTDAISDILYTPSQDADQQLLKEGVDPTQIVFVGNIMIDTLFQNLEKAMKTEYYRSLGLDRKNFSVLTLHRPSNVDTKESFEEILSALQEILKTETILFPLHPRARQKIEQHHLEHYFNSDGVKPNQINILSPLGYTEMLNLVANAKFVLTDSGGLQEETTALGIPCITLRENTERPITISEGTNYLGGVRKKSILSAFHKMKESPKSAKIPDYWDGHASERIVAHLQTFLKKKD